MKSWTTKKYKTFRNILLISGMTIAFAIWLAIPHDRVAVGLLGTDTNPVSKFALLPAFGLFLFSFLGSKRKNDNSHASGKGWRIQPMEPRNIEAAHDQVMYAIVADILVIGFMLFTLIISI